MLPALKTTDLKPFDGQMIKPNELIEIKGTGPLTLADRRIFNVLLNNAWGKDIVKHQHVFTIKTSNLKYEDQNCFTWLGGCSQRPIGHQIRPRQALRRITDHRRHSFAVGSIFWGGIRSAHRSPIWLRI